MIECFERPQETYFHRAQPLSDADLEPALSTFSRCLVLYWKLLSSRKERHETAKG